MPAAWLWWRSHGQAALNCFWLTSPTWLWMSRNPKHRFVRLILKLTPWNARKFASLVLHDLALASQACDRIAVLVCGASCKKVVRARCARTTSPPIYQANLNPVCWEMAPKKKTYQPRKDCARLWAMLKAARFFPRCHAQWRVARRAPPLVPAQRPRQARLNHLLRVGTQNDCANFVRNQSAAP